MNRTDLVLHIAERLELTKAEVEEVVDAMLDGVAHALQNGEEVKLTGFGNFKVKERAARQGTNPSDGSHITIPASKTISFKPAKHLKDSL